MNRKKSNPLTSSIEVKRIILIMIILYVIIATLNVVLAAGPSTSIPDSASATSGVTINGFLDVFFAYDFNSPADHVRQPFLYNHNRHNEVNLNLGFVRAAYTGNNVRSNLALQGGTYAQDNYSGEQDLLKHIFEANVGVALNGRQTLWLDAGIFPSHIGFESAISADNPTLSRSLLAENSPYFLSGVMVSYEMTKNVTASAVLTNGWQRIARPEGNQTPAFGTQLNFHPSDQFKLNWSTFIGSDTPDSVPAIRYFNNLYAEWKAHDKLQLILGFDAGLQQAAGSNGYNRWLSPVIIARQKMTERLYAAGRLEYYSDPQGVIISYASDSGFRTSGASVNLDYYLQPNVLFRLEARHLRGPDKIFLKANDYIQQNTTLITSMSVKF